MAEEATAGTLAFEAALARLEEVARSLEAGDVSLEEAMNLFQEGITLARQCSERLDEAEGRIERLLETQGGAVKTAPFEAAGAEQ